MQRRSCFVHAIHVSVHLRNACRQAFGYSEGRDDIVQERVWGVSERVTLD